MSNLGWIKLHRKMLDNPIMTSGDSYLLQLWLYLLLSVNAIEKRFLFNGDEMVLKPGQGIFGLNQIVKDCTIYKDETTTNFKRCKTIYYRRLKILEKLGNVKLQPTNKFTVITITNWNTYQSNETQVKLKRNSSETPVLTNKNDKNEDNDINITNVMDKSDVFAKRYGNADVNTVLARLSNLSPTGKLDGTDTDNRRMAHNLIRLYTLKVVLQSISNIPGSFYEGKVTSVRKLKNSLNALLVSETKGGIASI